MSNRLTIGLLIFVIALIGSVSALDELKKNAFEAHYGSQALARFSAWEQLIEQNQDASVEQKLRAVNQFFNQQVRFIDDSILWHQTDYWATPLETLGQAGGDCEDFSIAKYMTLIRLGLNDNNLRLIYVKAKIGGSHSSLSQAHMVLGYYSSASAMPLVLDNLVSPILLASERNDLTPVFSFNRAGLWVGNNAQSQADPKARLSKWRELLNKLDQEAIYEP